MLKNRRYFIYAIILIAAIAIKLFLFAFSEIYIPASKFQPDSPAYLQPAAMMASNGVFAVKDESGGLKYETLRTPGYPLFLAIFHNKMKIPLSGVIFIQIFLTTFVAWITYKTAAILDIRVALLSAVIILFDPPITIFSQIILTEALFLFLISLFMFEFTRYLKYKGIKNIVSTALILVAATYVRPVAYYLGAAMAVFIVYANMRENLKKGLIHAVVFFAIVYSLLGIWQVRNYVRCGESVFSNISQQQRGISLIHSYVRNADPVTRGMAPVPYYLNVTSRCLMSIMTRPGTLKDFHSDILVAIGKILAYPWMVFWLIGFIAGIAAVRRNVYLQSYLYIILYLMAAAIVSIMWQVSERFRVPMMPFIAIIASYGWMNLVGVIRFKFFHKGQNGPSGA